MERNHQQRQPSACHPNKLLVLAESASSTLVEEEENGTSRIGAVVDVGGLFGIGGYRSHGCHEEVDDDEENHGQRRRPPRNSSSGRRCYRGSDLFDNDEDDHDNEAALSKQRKTQQRERRQQRGERGEQENDDTVNLMTEYRDMTFVGCALPTNTTRRRGSSRSKKDTNRRKSTGSILSGTVKSNDLSTLGTKKTVATTKATIDAIEAEKKPSKQRVSHSKATSTANSSSSLLSLQRSISTATTVQLTGRGGVPIYHSMPISECEVLQPVGRWKYRFKTSNAVSQYSSSKDGNRDDDDDIGIPVPPTKSTKQSTTQQPPRLSPLRFVETELHIGTVVIDCFRRRDVVTLHSRHESMASNDEFLDGAASANPKSKQAESYSAIGTLTITIAEPGSNQLAIIALLRHVPLDWCRAVGLHSIGDSARLDHVIHFLYTQQQQASPSSHSSQSPMFFQFWSIGIPATLMSHCLYTNLMALPNDTVASNQKSNRRASYGNNITKQFMCHNDDYEEDDDENLGAAVCRLLPSATTTRK